MILSVVIPVYNTSAYLEDCVNSVLACDCTDCEIILVDDGSTDGICPQLCDRIAAEHPHLIRVIHQENRGLGGARNTGLEVAEGEYIIFPDSDDTVTPDALTIIKKAIDASKAEIIAYNFLAHDGEGWQEVINANQVCLPTPFQVKDHPEYLLSMPTAGSRAWKRSLFLRTGIRFPSRVWYEDLRTSLKLMVMAKSIYTIEDCLYCYYLRPGSIIRSGNIDRNREIMDAFEDLLPWFKAQGLYDTYRDSLCSVCIEHVYISASLRVLHADLSHPLPDAFRAYVQEKFPDYRRRHYLSRLTFRRRWVFRLLEGRHYRLLGLLFRPGL
ncbi:MAG: glycosyltransferase family 2 protein [Ruminococcaceae bacterium]|nr:glycosyltransferase family 2 protein [Oscillospiraceae bacterium]